jgi:hypothetical protein
MDCSTTLKNDLLEWPATHINVDVLRVVDRSPLSIVLGVVSHPPSAASVVTATLGNKGSPATPPVTLRVTYHLLILIFHYFFFLKKKKEFFHYPCHLL